MWVKIEAVLDSKYRVTWGAANTQFPHALSIDAEALRQEADAMRSLLAALSEWCSTDDPAPRVAKLHEIAAVGARLRYLLFNDPQKKDIVKKLEMFIADEYAGGDHELSIQPDESIYIPWGLIYDGKPVAGDVEGATVQDQEIKRFGGFWALKYSLTASTCFLSKTSARRPRNKFGLLSLVDEQVEHDIEADLGHDEYRRYRELLSPPIGTGYNLDRCYDLISKSTQRDILLYFLGHHSNAKLELGSDAVDYVEFSQLLDAIADREGSDANACGLVFLNGCESALGKEGMSLRNLSARPELSGMIATEGVVRRSFAAKVGKRLLQSLVAEGRTVADAMDTLHRDPSMWPESLLYGCYAHRDYCIEKVA